MSSSELIANLFRISQTEEKLKRDDVKDSKIATTTHHTVGKEVRGAIKKIGGTLPEKMPTPPKSIDQVTREQIEKLKAKGKRLMLDA